MHRWDIQTKPDWSDYDSRELFARNNCELNVLDCRAIYSSIYTFSHSENGPASYSLDQTGNAAYERFIDAIAESLNSQWRKNSCTDDVSKDDRHVLRIAVILHVFYDQLKKGLRGEDPTPPSGVVTLTTLQQAIALCKYFTVQRRILDQVRCNKSKRFCDMTRVFTITFSTGYSWSNKYKSKHTLVANSWEVFVH